LPTILLIDDDTAALSALHQLLDRSGYVVQAVSSLDQARRYLDDADPDLIVLEVDTDQGKGWELLRDVVRFEGPPTIVVTRRGREEEVVEALARGAVDVLPKPYRGNELIARVRSRLEQPPPEQVPVRPGRSPSSPKAGIPPVFMNQADEQTLLEPRGVVPTGQQVDDGLPLGTRFHNARRHRKLSLVQVNLDTRIPIWYLQAMEEEKFGLLPRGPAGAQMIQQYASYLGLDPAQAVVAYRSHHDATAFTPIRSLGGVPERRPIPIWLSVLVAAALALALGGATLWWLVGDQLPNVRANLRTMITRPTATATASPTRPPTLTPRPSSRIISIPEPAGGRSASPALPRYAAAPLIRRP
jgi:DNA-binding response OmpR family regulator